MQENKLNLAGRTLFITGASRGIGLAIAKRAAQDGANIAIIAKTTEVHPKLPGTIFTAAEEIQSLGGQALPIKTDIRFQEQVQAAVVQTVSKFGGIDICINNASAINLAAVASIDMKQFDLINQINGRGTFLCAKLCLPYLKKSTNPHILTMSPPLNMHKKWFQSTLAYTLSKYAMSMCTLGMAAEFKSAGIAVNSLWPRSAIDTAAVRNLLPFAMEGCRKDSIVADAAHHILTQPAHKFSGNFFIDETVLRDAGVTDFDKYACNPGAKLALDYFLEDDD